MGKGPDGGLQVLCESCFGHMQLVRSLSELELKEKHCNFSVSDTPTIRQGTHKLAVVQNMRSHILFFHIDSNSPCCL